MQADSNGQLAYGINQAVKATCLGRSFLYEEIRAGRLKTFKVGTRTLIDAEDLASWLEIYKKAK